MKAAANGSKGILVLDVGGTHVKCLATGRNKPVKFKSGMDMTPEQMVTKVLELTHDWNYQAVSIGYPGVVHRGRIVHEPKHLGSGWLGFNFVKAFGHPVKIMNDAAMQALGGYQGGRMLFLGLGTGLGSALIIDQLIAPMELGHLHYTGSRTYEDYLGEVGRKRLGNKKWRHMVLHVIEGFRRALLPDYIVIGGGNVKHLKQLPPNTRRGDNAYAFTGGFRLWERRSIQAALRANITRRDR